MSVIKQLSVFRDNNWQVDDIGADVGNITLNNTASLTDILPVITLTPNKALVSDSSGIIAASSVTSAQLSYLSGTTANIQNQINTLNSNLNFIIKTYEYTVGNVSPGNTANVSASQFQVSTPDGYSVLGVQRVSYNDDKMTIRGFIPTSTGSQIMVYGKNDGTVSTASSLKANITIIYAKTELVN